MIQPVTLLRVTAVIKSSLGRIHCSSINEPLNIASALLVTNFLLAIALLSSMIQPFTPLRVTAVIKSSLGRIHCSSINEPLNTASALFVINFLSAIALLSSMTKPFTPVVPVIEFSLDRVRGSSINKPLDTINILCGKFFAIYNDFDRAFSSHFFSSLSHNLNEG